jgi:NADPH2:quinone reductase
MSQTMMRAAIIRTPGAPEVLEIQERPRPLPGTGEVLLRVSAAGVNGADLLQRRGKYPVPPGISPDIMGLEAAGTVAELGAGAHRWRVGDQVTALLAGGGYAEYVAVPEGQCLPWPTGYEATQAAALPETCCTVWSNVFEIGGLQAGETLLVHGGASGIGTTAIQLAVARGAAVLATVGAPKKKQICLELGARQVVDYRTEDFVAQTLQETQGKGVQVILDVVGGSYLPRNLAALAHGGRLVIIATRGGNQGELDIAMLMRKQARVTGSVLRPRPLEEKGRLVAEVYQNVWPLITQGRFHPVIDSVFPLDQARLAHERLESGQHVGKIVLTTEQ